VPREAASSIDELIAGATERSPLGGTDGKSGATLERVVIDGERFVLKQLHPDADWTMRGFGDLGCRPVEVWTSGLLDAVPPSIDHAVVNAAAGLGRNGWGGALLLRDVGEHLVPEGDLPLSLEAHRQLLDHLADLSAAFWAPTARQTSCRWRADGARSVLAGWRRRRGSAGPTRSRGSPPTAGLGSRTGSPPTSSPSSTGCATTWIRWCVRCGTRR
jgi:hypothetical protein